jgi:hypothetical protein
MCTANSQPSCESDESRVVSTYAKKRAETIVLFRHLKGLNPQDSERERLHTRLIEDH